MTFIVDYFVLVEWMWLIIYHIHVVCILLVYGELMWFSFLFVCFLFVCFLLSMFINMIVGFFTICWQGKHFESWVWVNVWYTNSVAFYSLFTIPLTTPTISIRPLHGIAIFEWKRGLTCKNDVIHQHVALLCASVCEWLQICGWIVGSYFPER